ncbi:Nucleotidylyl transferase [Macrolepiota fuliginosa MF-IS2]|uniref:arginine--tRNA ligase n=1 Tax=Macrolepiota fuliginosa MF-IS2 TaxID=1400762 RepID=A0A9P5XAG6_9AGAR|nr:Nucleotidylyl transferase [Macrolepiota fuliginosa MF-IS2]
MRGSKRCNTHACDTRNGSTGAEDTTREGCSDLTESTNGGHYDYSRRRSARKRTEGDDALGLSINQVYPCARYSKKGVDFAAALPRFRLPGSVNNLAKKVIDNFQANDYVSTIQHDKAFLHFTLNTNNLTRDVLTQVHDLGKKFSTNETGKGKKLVISILGHLRSTTIGAFLANLYHACGWEVISFGLVAVGLDTIKYLVDIYVKIKKDAALDPQREFNVKKYEAEYDRLNVQFDEYTGESAVSQESIDKVLDRPDEMGLIEGSGGTKLINLKKWELDKVVVKSEVHGASVYLTRDISDFARFFKVLKLRRFPWAQDLTHIKYGLMQGMSARKGTVRNEKKKNVVIEDPETTSRETGITGIKIQDVATKRSRMGDMGSHLQYAHVRLASIGRKNSRLFPLSPPSQGSYLGVVPAALNAQELNGVVTILFRLAHAVSGADVIVVPGEMDVQRAGGKVLLFGKVREVIAAGMTLLSIRLLDRM